MLVVHTRSTFLLYSFRLDRRHIQYLLEADGIDLWYVGLEGNVDFRVSREKFRRMYNYLFRCWEEGSVEELVRETEKREEEIQLKKTQPEWFEEFVSILITAGCNKAVEVFALGV